MIIPGSLGALAMWFLFPDTKGRPLEEIAAIFGDQDEMAIYADEDPAVISQVKAEEPASEHELEYTTGPVGKKD